MKITDADKHDMKITDADKQLLARLPVGRWFAAGALSIHAAKLTRLVRLGLLKRQYASGDVSRSWDYLRPAAGNPKCKAWPNCSCVLQGRQSDCATGSAAC